MGQGGHSSPAAAIMYQHATDDRANVVTHRLGAVVEAPTSGKPTIALVPEVAQKGGGPDVHHAHSTNIVPFTRADTEQSQRGSNPCSHLERVVS